MTEISDEARELRKAYQREWNRKNRDKVRQHQVNYWEKKLAQMKAADKEGADA